MARIFTLKNVVPFKNLALRHPKRYMNEKTQENSLYIHITIFNY
jgi:hypothetical protein